MLGIAVASLTPELAKAPEISEDRGVVVTSVQSGRVAARGGIRPGDVILAIGDQQISGVDEQSVRMAMQSSLPMDFDRQRRRLVEFELRRLGVRDERVLHAMAIVPREEFVPLELRHAAYENIPLPIECGQTVSQPLVVAHMAEALALEPDDRALEIGAGSGYAAAILSHLAKEVFTVEVHPELAASAAERLHRLGYANVHVRCADGTFGWPEAAPFDAIVAAAASPTIPPALLTQLKVGGRLVIPIGLENRSQELLRVVRRSQDEFASEELGAVRFVPFVSPAAEHP